MKRLILSAAVVMAFVSASNAGTPGTKTSKSDVSTEGKTQQVETTYYVVGQSGSNYLISTNPSHAANCGSGSIPCEFTSPDDALGTSIPKALVDNQDEDIQITQRRLSLP